MARGRGGRGVAHWGGGWKGEGPLPEVVERCVACEGITGQRYFARNGVGPLCFTCRHIQKRWYRKGGEGE